MVLGADVEDRSRRLIKDNELSELDIYQLTLYVVRYIRSQPHPRIKIISYLLTYLLTYLHTLRRSKQIGPGSYSAGCGTICHDDCEIDILPELPNAVHAFKVKERLGLLLS